MSFSVYTEGPQTAADWMALNPVLPQFTFGLEIDSATGQYTKAKLGDGRTAWNDLGYWNPAGSSGGGGSLEVPTGTVNGINDTFVCSGPPIQVFLRKLLQLEGTDYTVASSTITFDAGNIPQTGDEIQVMV